jgi:hypothetical protein
VRTLDAAALRPNDRLANGAANANRSILDAEKSFRKNMLQVAIGDAKAIVKNRKDDRPVFSEPTSGCRPGPLAVPTV